MRPTERCAMAVRPRICGVRQLLLALYIVLAVADAEAATIPDEQALLRILRNALQPSAVSPARQEELQVLSPSALLASGNAIPPQLANVEKVPGGASEIFQPSGDTVMSRLRMLSKDIETLEPTLSAADRQSLERARALLYTRSAEKTRDYERYLEYAAKYKATQANLRSADNPAKRSGLLVALRRLEQDWETYGNRSQLDQALEVEARLGRPSVADAKIAWEQTLKFDQDGDYASFWQEFSAATGWITLAIPIGQGSMRGAVASGGSAGAPTSKKMAVGGVTHVFLKMRLFTIPRRSLSNPFLRSPYWRNTKSYVLADGTTAHNPAELLPKATRAVIVLKNVEVIFSSEADWKSVQSLLSQYDSVSLSGLSLKEPGSPSPFVAPLYMGVSAPLLFGVTVVDLPKIPNPVSSKDWPEWPF